MPRGERSASLFHIHFGSWIYADLKNAESAFLKDSDRP